MIQPFQWAGFTFPRRIVEMPYGSREDRLSRARAKQACGYYCHAPAPITGGAHPGRGVYHEGNALGRWAWCDDVCSGIRHEGWYVDELGDTKIRGFVIRLPRGRFLAGWSMGRGMAATIEGEVYTDIDDAARAADSAAEQAAEREREYQARWQEARRIEEEREEAQRTAEVTRERIRGVWGVRNNETVRRLIREWLDAVREADDAASSASERLESYKDVT